MERDAEDRENEVSQSPMPKSSVRTLIFEGWVNFQALTTRTQSSLNLTALFKALVMERQQSSCDDDMHARARRLTSLLTNAERNQRDRNALPDARKLLPRRSWTD